MSRMFMRQSTQFSKSLNYIDNKQAGQTALINNAETLEDDLNSLRSQINRILDSDLNGKWYDEVPESWPAGDRRGLKQLGEDLRNIESHSILFRTQHFADILVPNGQNFVVLRQDIGQAPNMLAAVGNSTTSGACVAYFSMPIPHPGSHSMNMVTSSNPILPLNLCLISDAFTGNVIQVPETSTQYPKSDVYALLQSQTSNGDGFDDGLYNKKVQLSFVVIDRSGDTPTFAPCPISAISQKTINYSYIQRKMLDDIPSDAFLDGIFIDAVYDISSSLINSIRLDNMLMNQNAFGPIAQDKNLILQLDDSKWSFENKTGTKKYFVVDNNSGSGSISSNVQTSNINSSFSFNISSSTSSFTDKITVSSLGTSLLFDTGSIKSSNNMLLNSFDDMSIISGKELIMSDANKSLSSFSSSFKLASASGDWDTYKNAAGEAAIFDAISKIKGQRRFDHIVANLSGKLMPSDELDYSFSGLDFTALDFINGVNVYLNGQLMRNGTGHDVEIGTLSNYNLKFNFVLFNGDLVTVVIPNKF